MDIRVGDKVRFLNDVGGGTVVKILDKRNVLIMNDFDFEVPALLSDIIVVEEAASYSEGANSEQKTANSQVITEQEEVIVDTNDIFYPEVSCIPESGNDINIHLAFVPQKRPGSSDLDVFFINDSNYNVLYSIINKDENGKTYSNSVGVLEANVKEQIETVIFASINTIPEYIFHLIFYRKDDFQIVEPIVKTVKINPVKFYKEKSYTPNDFFDEDAILYQIVANSRLAKEINSMTERDIKNVIKQKEQQESKPKPISRKVKEQEIMEVDLHIHELLDDFRGLTNGEMMEIQLQHFKTKLAEAFKNKIRKVVFIHGVGNGSLKTEVRKELDKMGKKLSYQDASFKEYGYGATMVHLKM